MTNSVKYTLVGVMLGVLALSVQACSLIPEGSPTVVVCEIPPKPQLPPIDEDGYARFGLEERTDLLLYFDGVDHCLRQLNSD